MGKEFTNLTEKELCDMMCGKPEEDQDYITLTDWYVGERVAVIMNGKQLIREVYERGGKQYILVKNEKYYKEEFRRK